MEDSQILLYIEGKATLEQERQVLRWINQGPENRKYYNRMKNQWVISHLPAEKASDDELNEMNQLIRSRQRANQRTVFYKIAAILILPLLLLNGYLFFVVKKQPVIETIPEPMAMHFVPMDTMKPYMTYQTSRGVKGKAELPDGSTVWLNSDSYLRVPVSFDSIQRVVEFSGEGYFDVVSNPAVPMVIKTDKSIELVVHGTKFNLTSYKEDGQVTTSLYEGRITVHDFNNNDVVDMAPNTTMTFQKTKSVQTRTHEVTQTSDKWRDGELIFDNTPFPEIVLKLERWYGIRIFVNDPSFNKYTFTGHFYSESISQVLDMFQASSDLKFRVNKNEVIVYK